MQNDWILDVLSDLKTFAQQNGMSDLAEQLDDTRLIALGELAMTREDVPTHGECAAASAGIFAEHSRERL
ncbi:hypothetical protein EI983_03050 [Roseovarius faecimaris]|uniref:Uncharacterized protein n=1 Tax=Roseovarius faecimaris TaxID=2494550 RepID=A0A6I6IXE2_9RHOB|nr:hypothetical protein [Roseovarius faecimaris]QGX97308.1 hypothetical protein EI983_03050 [Roseovarius faecimaris]